MYDSSNNASRDLMRLEQFEAAQSSARRVAGDPENIPNREHFVALVKLLIKLGDDADELAYWLDVYEDLPKSRQQTLLDILQDEVQKLSA